MKKKAKAPEKPNSPQKTSRNRKKKPSGTRKKGAADAFMAVVLAGALIAVSALISIAVITVHASVNKLTQGSPVVPGFETQVPVSSELPVPPASAAPEEPAPSPLPGQAQPAAASEKNTSVPSRNIVPEKPVITVSIQPAAQRATPPELPPENRGTLVFIIDDAGNNLRELEPFLRFPGPLTIAVLPGLPHSAQAARLIRAAGKEVFLHQPMEAMGGQPPGPGAIYSGMSADEIKSILSRNLAEIGPAAGINNHQGSKITMDNEAMETILGFCAEHGLNFLDSRTTAETVVPAAALRLGITIGERDVFIDNEQDKTSMVRYIGEGLKRARQRGSAILIGHAWSPELAPALAELYPELEKQGYSFASASALIRNRAK
jgi:polysaccharide deacetylase 2 family uncharacterized protein YibQ